MIYIGQQLMKALSTLRHIFAKHFVKLLFQLTVFGVFLLRAKYWRKILQCNFFSLEGYDFSFNCISNLFHRSSCIKLSRYDCGYPFQQTTVLLRIPVALPVQRTKIELRKRCMLKQCSTPTYLWQFYYSIFIAEIQHFKSLNRY